MCVSERERERESGCIREREGEGEGVLSSAVLASNLESGTASVAMAQVPNYCTQFTAVCKTVSIVSFSL